MTLTAHTFQAELLEYIESEVATADEPIGPDTDLLLTGLVDSLGVLLVVDWIAQRLGIAIDPGDVVLEHFQTVELMVRYVDGRGALSAR